MSAGDEFFQISNLVGDEFFQNFRALRAGDEFFQIPILIFVRGR